MEELGDLLEELGWTRRELAYRLGIRPGTISEWGSEPPKYAMAYLRLAAAVKHRGAALADLVEPMLGKKGKSNGK